MMGGSAVSSRNIDKSKNRTDTIKVDYLARVEGEGSLYVKIKNNRVVDAKFKIFEPPRFFEAFLRGRKYYEAPDITARICGICPIAYQMSSARAMENAFGIKVDGPIRELRRLIYCGEWIQSHALHVYMLHAPDFLGYESVIHMAKDYEDVVKQALELKKIGNELMQLIGGRDIHPINAAVGGFYRIPPGDRFPELAEKLKWARDASIAMVRLVAGFNFPDLERDYEYVALKHPKEYPFNEGRLVSNKGLDIDISEYENHFEEIHAEHSNALQSVNKVRGAYHVGPLARFNLNFEQLPKVCKDLAKELNFLPPLNNPFKSIVARSIETLFACEEALRIMENFKVPEQPRVEMKVRAGTGYGCTEAPRGICWHKYTVDDEGIIQFAKIVPPTSQNQRTIEEDLRDYVSRHVDTPKDRLTRECEQAIRNYDPCISCATHFLKLEIDRD
jgi:coenzyme F420-reducing hydrogenase alpha subunit